MVYFDGRDEMIEFNCKTVNKIDYSILREEGGGWLKKSGITNLKRANQS